MIKFDPDHPDYSLRMLVHKFEQDHLQLENIDSQFLNFFGIGILSNSLPIQFPKIPEFDKNIISEYMKSEHFSTFMDLVKHISRLKTDIEKLYAVYYYTCHNIQFDLNSELKNIEEIFTTGLAQSEGYSRFFLRIGQISPN